ncbi:MAG: hypothetical protein ACE5J3_07905, partial [Methanosarcinales archaeon]
YKLNIGEVFKQINERTKEYGGMKVPVKLIIDKKSREYDIEIGTPPVSSLIKKELGIEKAKVETAEATKPNTTNIEEETTEEIKPKEMKKGEGKTTGNLTIQQCVKIAKMKQDDLLAKNLRAAVKQVVGTCVSMMGITIENKQPKEIIKEIDEGKWDHLF